MIYSKRLQNFVPVNISKESYDLRGFGYFTKYTIKDKKIPIGFVDLKDTPNGVHVEFIKNQHPDLYSGFGKIADQIEVEHCLQRGLDTFEITSEAALNSHAIHYKRGKRFLPERFNKIVQNIIEQTPIGAQYNTKKLGKIEMYMPINLINKYIELIKKHPLLK